MRWCRWFGSGPDQQDFVLFAPRMKGGGSVSEPGLPNRIICVRNPRGCSAALTRERGLQQPNRAGRTAMFCVEAEPGRSGAGPEQSHRAEPIYQRCSAERGGTG